MTTTKIFIINYDCEMELDDGLIFKKIYNNLESAKQELNRIYNTTPDFKYYGYRIMVYSLEENNEYVFTNRFIKYNSFANIFEEYLNSD